ncbi:unnamed protein product [Meloidogyne enterolobii]|uniref:Uncharacterized protein n=2 Tax=Meloidogyne enterolobii TaxID=390850 RepID=A0ACB0YE11_MELEN
MFCNIKIINIILLEIIILIQLINNSKSTPLIKAPAKISSPHFPINLKNNLASDQKFLNNKIVFNNQKNKKKNLQKINSSNYKNFGNNFNNNVPKKKINDENYKNCKITESDEEYKKYGINGAVDGGKREFVSKEELIQNRNDLENKIDLMVEEHLVGKNKRKRVPNMLILPFDELWKNKKIFENKEMREMIKREWNLKMVAYMIKNDNFNIDERLDEEEIIPDLNEAVKLKIVLDECDRINEFLMALCIVEEQMKYYKEWENQRSFHDIQQVLNSLFGAENVKILKDIDKIAENELDNLHSADDVLLSYLSSSQSEVDEIIERIYEAENVVYKAKEMVKKLNKVYQRLEEEKEEIPKIGKKKDENEKMNKDEAEEMGKEELKEVKKIDDVDNVKKEEPNQERKA